MTTNHVGSNHRNPPSSILGTRHLRSRGPRTVLPPGGGSLWGLQAALGWRPPLSRLCLHLPVASPLFPLVSLRRTLSLDGGPPSSRRTSSQIPHSITPAKPLFLNGVPFTASRRVYL